MLIAVLILQCIDLLQVSQRIGPDRFSRGEAAYEGFAWAREDKGPEPPSKDQQDEEKDRPVQMGDHGDDHQAPAPSAS